MLQNETRRAVSSFMENAQNGLDSNDTFGFHVHVHRPFMEQLPLMLAGECKLHSNLDADTVYPMLDLEYSTVQHAY